MIHICLRQPRQVVQTEPTRKVEKKKKKKGRLWTTNANRLQITVNLKKIHHLRRAFRRFCASSHPSYKCFMLENLAFFHNSSKTPDNADIANRKHYSAPAGALTFIFGCLPKMTTWILKQPFISGCFSWMIFETFAWEMVVEPNIH